MAHYVGVIRFCLRLELLHDAIGEFDVFEDADIVIHRNVRDSVILFDKRPAVIAAMNPPILELSSFH